MNVSEPIAVFMVDIYIHVDHRFLETFKGLEGKFMTYEGMLIC
jgi:hypothetical protein